MRHIHLQVFGRVQGVGFRYTTVRTAASYDVTGFVQNLPNGDVLLVAEGSADEVRKFVDDVARRKSYFILNQKRLVEPATGEFKSFRIRY